MRAMPTIMIFMTLLGITSGFAPAAVRRATCRPARRVAFAPVAAAAEDPATVVITDMDETLITRKSTTYVIKFLVMYRAVFRLLMLPLLIATLIPLSKVKRALAVKIMYYFAFRGVRVDKAKQIAADLGERYARDLQDPAASAVLGADQAVIITASPSFMARPWLEKYLGVPASNVYGADLTERNGRFTGMLSGEIPIGQTKVQLLKASVAARAKTTVGYGDHPTDVPFLEACDRGVLVHELSAAQAGSCEYQPARPFDLTKLAALR